MAVTRSSTEYAKIGTRDANAEDFESGLKVAVASYTHSAGAETDLTLNVMKLPAGRIRIYSHLSKIFSTQMATNADLHLGFAAYTKEDGSAGSADDNAFADNLDAGAAAIDAAWALPSAAGEWTEFNTQDGLIIQALVDTANIEDTDTIHVVCVYSKVD